LGEEFISRFSANVKCDRKGAVKAILEPPRADFTIGNCNILGLNGLSPDFETYFNWELIKLWEHIEI
jgi:hypothetical protein